MFIEKFVNALKLFSTTDVYLLPGLAEVDPRQVDLRTRFTIGVELSIPIASSPMDMVTELDMAIAMALLGGIGVVHRNMEVEKQMEIVRKVKQHPPIRMRILYVESGVPCSRIAEAMYSYGLRNIPMTINGSFVGYVHLSDLRNVCREGFETVEGRPGRVYRLNEVDEARRALIEGSADTVAIVDLDGRYMGTVVYYDILEDAQPTKDSEGRLAVAAAISPFDRQRAMKLDRYVDALVSDVAHFHNTEVLKAAKELVKNLSSDFVIGNIATAKAVEDAVTTIERFDGLRVGLGGGSICTTPEVTGVYVPTLYAVAMVSDAIDRLNIRVPVIADGGLRTPSDIVKVLAAGASTAMLGYMLAGTDEASAPLITIGSERYKPYRGMASEGAMARRFAVDRYARVSKRVAEGIEGMVPYRGSVYTVISRMIEAVKAGFGYVGVRNIDELWRKAQFAVVQRRDRDTVYTSVREKMKDD